MSRVYAKVSIEMWGDKKFGELSGFEPSGKALWLYLLTGKFRTSIPGLNVDVGIGALSDRLGWTADQVQEKWLEIECRDMAAADWKAGVIFLPNGIEHNAPENPNVIKGWGRVVVPECDLTRKALDSLERWIRRNMKPPFYKAFRETFRKGYRKQEQEQEQEQEDPPQPPAARGPKVSMRKPTTAEANRAEQYLRTIARCPHDPACTAHDECVGKLVYAWRHNQLVGMQEEAAS